MVPYDFFEAQDEAVRPAASRLDASAPLLTRRVHTSIAPAAAACINGVAPLLSTTSTRHLRFNSALTASRFPAAAATWRGVARSRARRACRSFGRCLNNPSSAKTWPRPATSKIEIASGSAASKAPRATLPRAAA